MSERTKLIALMALLGVLAIAAAYAVFGPKGLTRKGARRQTAKMVAEELIANPLPTASAFGELAEWLAPEGSGIMLASAQAGPIFGLPPKAVVEQPPTIKPQTPVVRQTYAAELPKLQGIFWSTDRPSALIAGESYRVGQKVKNTNFVVISIGTSAIKLRSDRGEEIVLDFLK